MAKQTATNLPAQKPEETSLTIPNSSLDLYAQAAAEIGEVTEEQRALYDQTQKGIQGGLPFGAMRQKGGPESILGGLKFNDGRADMELPQELIVIASIEGRVKWDPNDLAAPPQCKSNDGEKRLEGVPAPGQTPAGCDAELCQDCICRLWPSERNRLAAKMGAEWLRQPSDPADKPECADVMNVLVALPDLSDIFIISLHGMSLKPAANYLNRFKRRKLPNFVLTTLVSSGYQKSPKGDFYMFQWAEGGLTPKETMSKINTELADLWALLTSRVEQFDSIFDRDWTSGAQPQGYPADADWGLNKPQEAQE